MEEWQKRLAHERAVRDAYVACGNPKPKQPDPEGGLRYVRPYRFDGKIFYASIESAGHSEGAFEDCKCSK